MEKDTDLPISDLGVCIKGARTTNSSRYGTRMPRREREREKEERKKEGGRRRQRRQRIKENERKRTCQLSEEG